MMLGSAAGQNIGEWGYGIGVFGAAHGHTHECETPSLLADMCGFKSEEEMEDTKAYLHSHGGYQLEQVGADLCLFSGSFQVHCPVALVVVGVVRQLIAYSVLMGQVADCFNGYRGGKVTGCFS